MVFRLGKKFYIVSGTIIACVVLLMFLLPAIFKNSSAIIVAGGNVRHAPQPAAQHSVTASNTDNIDDTYPRFRRPSPQIPLANPYSFSDFEKGDTDAKPPLITQNFDKPENVILAYYGILQPASNMVGYSGGCGSIGYGKTPYPYAYELFTPEKQKQLSQKKFTDSFKGIGYITLLKMQPAYAPPDTPVDIKYFMIELETIQGYKQASDASTDKGTFFTYYYALITVQQTPQNGWKIKQIDLYPENFLCAPEHSWFYLSDAVVQIVYGDNLKIIEKIDKTEQNGDMIYVFASGHGKQYRFDFVRLTNGYDVLLHENVLENGAWQETNLLTEPWKNLKFILNSVIKPDKTER